MKTVKMKKLFRVSLAILFVLFLMQQPSLVLAAQPAKDLYALQVSYVENTTGNTITNNVPLTSQVQMTVSQYEVSFTRTYNITIPHSDEITIKTRQVGQGNSNRVTSLNYVIASLPRTNDAVYYSGNDLIIEQSEKILNTPSNTTLIVYSTNVIELVAQALYHRFVQVIVITLV